MAKLPKGGCIAEVGGWPAQGEGDLLGEFDWEFDSDLLGHPYIMSHSGLELWFREKKVTWHMTFTQS